MEGIVSTCDRCHKEIIKGSEYISITKNIELIVLSETGNEDEVEMIQSDILVAFCESCGNKFDTDTLIKLINLTPGGTLEN